jgi:galactose mutarotase-like enzyme
MTYYRPMILENEFLKIAVRELGAELTSLFCKKTNTEHLWQADPNIWNWHAPTLFPVVGRCFNDTITVDNKPYKIEKHGFIRQTNFSVLSTKNDSLLMEIVSDEKTKTQYPFDFKFQIGYKLQGAELQVRYNVINTESKELLFSVGGHPAFNVPFSANEKYEDYYIAFENDMNLERFHINENGFFDGKKSIILNNSNKLNLYPQMFNDDALIFKNLQSRKVTIRSKNHEQFLSIHFSDFNYLGLWAKSGAPYVCIEPWLGCADENGFTKEFRQKEGIIQLPAGETFSAEYKIVIG